DQYVMHGGSSLWMIDATTQRLDTVSGNSFAFGIDLGLNDFFFKYGVRINPNLVKAIPPSYVVLATGEERDSDYTPFPWLFSPLVASETSHPIVNNIDPVKFEYVSSLDTLPNAIDKTLLLSTGIESKIIGLPAEIDLDREIPKNVEIMLQKENSRPGFNAGPVPVAVLLEGEFQSVYANRVKPFPLQNARDSSPVSKMVVISDGDVIKNQLDRGRPLELGYDKWTNKFHGNKEFLLNTVNYLLDDSGLINIRSKEIAVAFLDLDKTSEKRGLWQFVNLVVPLVLLLLFGIVFSYLRKRKFAR
ncbi:MAG: Gldg family protein, partial [Bacteroidia bacterium]|nr:Gldg family protein [Bacteroidia bacterium]